MRCLSKRKLVLLFIGITLFHSAAWAQTYLDTIGLTLFHETTTNLNGSGIRVAQPEGWDPFTSPGTNTWEVNPSNPFVGQPISLFTYTSSSGVANTFTNSVGLESGHANSVAQYFYGINHEEATNVAHVDCYDANYFIQVSEVNLLFTTNYTASLPSTNIDDAVVNQSFSFGPQPTNIQDAIDTAYDNYSAQYNTLFVSAVNNGGQVCAPGTSYNCIGIGAYGGGSSVGPTIDNGRCKPDLVAPASETSYSTPMVAGAATIMIQAAMRGDGGGHTNNAADMRTIKALLLNGAVKPVDWTNSSSSPLDARYGAGILNLFNSYQQLIGGQHGFSVSNSVTQGSPHPPPAITGTIHAPSGWDFNSVSSSHTPANDGVTHYFFEISSNVDVTATLVWERQNGQSSINKLALFLYDCANSNLVDCSTSVVDNVQHIFVPQLPQGTYDLQVWKAGGTFVSASESYALAWEFSATPMTITPSGSSINLSWPAYPAGFVLEATTNLNPPIIWSTNNLPFPVYSNGQEIVSFGSTNAAQFFQLAPP